MCGTFLDTFDIVWRLLYSFTNIKYISRDFLSGLSDDSVLLLLNEAVGQLAVSSDSAVGGASVRLILVMANQQGLRVQPLLLSFRGQRLYLLYCSPAACRTVQ